MVVDVGVAVVLPPRCNSATAATTYLTRVALAAYLDYYYY
jgi:hypothetical protein